MIYNVPLEYQQDSLREPKQVTSVSVNSLGQPSRVFISDCCQNLQNLATTQHFDICNTAVHGGPKKWTIFGKFIYIWPCTNWSIWSKTGVL